MPGTKYYVIFNTSAGWIGLLGSDTGLKRTTLPQASRTKVIAALDADTAQAILSQQYFKELVKSFKEYFKGQRLDFSDKVDIRGATHFQRKVWETTRKIPYGETRSYAWVAKQIGNHGAARAVGQALGKNLLPIVIPCHRVIASDGSLGGFGGGLVMKKHLLALEGKPG
ncbi:MAG: methylated-DNA--[protein]-cysteine S-methyltransferase [Dehalococcoidales bacterium]|nr:methylated-DNA--[protein]-cysteine S-methyltransferase [Dehalococcoidales bacterium]